MIPRGYVTFVIIKGRIEQNRWGKGLEFTVHAMELLQGLRESRAKSLDLKMSFKAIDDKLISELQDVLLKKENKGKCRVNFMIYDNLDKIHVNLFSRSVLINPTDELFKKLNSMNIDYKLN